MSIRLRFTLSRRGEATAALASILADTELLIPGSRGLNIGGGWGCSWP